MRQNLGPNQTSNDPFTTHPNRNENDLSEKSRVESIVRRVEAELYSVGDSTFDSNSLVAQHIKFVKIFEGILDN